jgi:hypothetical protein
MWYTLSKEREGSQMKIKVKNNKKQEISNADVEAVTRHYLGKLIGDRAEEIIEVGVTFKKLTYHIGGRVRFRNAYPNVYLVSVNSCNSLEEQLSTLAHECVHIKQYFLGELQHKTEWGRNRMRHVRIWKGRRYVRKAYQDRPWEIEARKYQDKLSKNVLNEIKQVAKPKAEPKPIKIIPQAVSDIEAKVLKVVELLNIENGNLVGQVLKGSTDKQYRIRVLKKVFDLKQRGILKEYIINGIVWVGKTERVIQNA